MWVELAIGVVSSAVGIIASLAISVRQISEQRIAMEQMNNFFADWRADHTYRLDRIDESLREILQKLG